MEDIIYKGILTPGDPPFLLGADGSTYFEDEIIWSGYLTHWSGMKVCARRLPQRDYEKDRPIIIMWPDAPLPEGPFVELYFNERLIKYPVSFLGHLAVNVNGEIFNFSHLINENEAMKREEYFYRPAQGEFAPHPVSGRDNADDPQKPYYDKFGRLFMRTIHALRISGLDTIKLSLCFHGELEKIRNTKPDPKRPGHYADFSIFTRSCSTVIRDGFRHSGFKNISGIFPRELFVNIAHYFLKQINQPLIKACPFTMHQLHVPEAASSAMPPLLNPLNRYKYRIVKKHASSMK